MDYNVVVTDLTSRARILQSADYKQAYLSGLQTVANKYTEWIADDHSKWKLIRSRCNLAKKGHKLCAIYNPM